ncbi:TY-Chap domain-containing protein [Nocardia tengchongensis]|uniref:TY-Chap domain-containing protein n=1 Tax=Nocardia tengchongensis TaxID=2055889 RepID=UPI003682D31A
MTEPEANDIVWQQFSSALALVLARLPAWSNIALEASGNRWVAFLMADRGLACELVGSDYLEPGHRLTSVDEQLLLLHNWGAPQRGHGWTRFLDWPARIVAYRDLADNAVTALRQVLRIGNPAELTLTGWPGNRDEAPDLTDLGIKVEAGTRPN